MPEKKERGVRDQGHKWPDSLDFEWSQQKQDEFRAVFGAAPQILNNLLAFCGVYAVNHANEPIEAGRCEGRRMVGLYILRMMDYAPIKQ